MNSEMIDRIRAAVKEIFPTKQIKSIIDKGLWFKHIFKIVFSDHSAVYVKLSISKESDIPMEANVISLLHEHSIQQPGLLHIDSSLKHIPYEYGIYEDTFGISLASYLLDGNKNELMEIYMALGEYYRKFADIPGSFAGVWDTVPQKLKYPLHPADAMLNLEILEGSGKALFGKEILTEKQYKRIINIWQHYIPQIKALPVHLTHFSPFPWSIYLDRNDNRFFVSKISALADILWWNEHATITHLLYPPFFDIDDSIRHAFLKAYGRRIHWDIIYCFLLLYRLCAVNNVYLQPDNGKNHEWKAKALSEIDALIQFYDSNDLLSKQI